MTEYLPRVNEEDAVIVFSQVFQRYSNPDKDPIMRYAEELGEANNFLFSKIFDFSNRSIYVSTDLRVLMFRSVIGFCSLFGDAKNIPKLEEDIYFEARNYVPLNYAEYKEKFSRDNRQAAKYADLVGDAMEKILPNLVARYDQALAHVNQKLEQGDDLGFSEMSLLGHELLAELNTDLLRKDIVEEPMIFMASLYYALEKQLEKK